MKWLPERFFRNSLSLYGVNAVNILLPWIYFPYLLQIIGPEHFGEIALATAIVQYIVFIVDYDYHYTAPRMVALLREQPQELKTYINSMFATRLFLFLFASVLLSGFILAGIIPSRLATLVFITAAGVFGYIFTPIFLYQGFEKMDRFSAILIGSKVLTAVSVFLLIRAPQDYLYYPVILTVLQLIAGLFSLMLLYFSFGVRFSKFVLKEVKEHLRSGLSIVVSIGSINIFSATNTMILGIFAPSSVVGSYAAGEKVIRAVQNLTAPIYRTLLPHTAKLANSSKSIAYSFIARTVGIILPCMLVLGALLYFGADIITSTIFSASFLQTPATIRVLSVVPIIAGVSSILMNVFLLGFGYNALWSKITISTGCLGIIMSYLLVSAFHLQHIGISVSIVLVEICILLASGSKFMIEAHSEKRRHSNLSTTDK